MTMTDDAADTLKVGGAQTIDRAIQVLRTVAQLQRSGATATRVAAATGLARPTAIRILRALTAQRMLVRGDGQRSYYLGPLAYELGLAVEQQQPKPLRWQSAVEQVARRTRLTSYLMARSGNEAVCRAC